jgi:hypothetical protein
MGCSQASSVSYIPEETVEEQWYPYDYQLSETDKNVAFRYDLNTGNLECKQGYVVCQRIEVITKVSCTNLKLTGLIIGFDDEGKYSDPENILEREYISVGPVTTLQSAMVEYGTLDVYLPVANIVFEHYCLQ